MFLLITNSLEQIAVYLCQTLIHKLSFYSIAIILSGTGTQVDLILTVGPKIVYLSTF